MLVRPAATRAKCDSLEMQCLASMTDAKDWFINEIVTTVDPDTRLSSEEIDVLKGDATFRVAEFYYLVDCNDLVDRVRMRGFLQRHNEDIRSLLGDKAKRTSLGLSVSRLEEGIFNDEQIQKVVHYIADGRLWLEQADLGRLLSLLMSPETTRKAIVVLGKAGLLDRVRIGSVLTASNGTLERCFEAHLKMIVDTLKGLLKERGEI